MIDGQPRYSAVIHRVAIGTIILLTFLSYRPMFQAGFIWDDDSYVTANPNLTSGHGLKSIWFDPPSSPQYYPMVFTTFWFMHQVCADNPLSYHLLNILLHCFNAVLVWKILQRLNISGALLIGFLFALHPIYVESVAWISELKNTLSGFFYLLSLYFYLPFSLADGGSANLPKHRRYWIALALFVAALLSKTVTSTLPVVILLIIWWQRKRVSRSDVLALVPFFAAGLAGGLLTIFLERHIVGASGSAWQLNLFEHLILAGRIICFYIGKIIWPVNLSFIYPRWTIDAADLSQYGYLLMAIGVVLFLWLKRQTWGRGPLTALLFFIVTLFPALGFINVYPMRFSYVADHFQYLASIGILVLLVSALIAGSRFFHFSTLVNRMLTIVLFGVLSCLTYVQSFAYHSSKTLYNNVLSKNPDSALVHNNLGLIYQSEGKLDEAFFYFNNALRIDPTSLETYINRGAIFFKAGQMQQALADFNSAIALNPAKGKAYYNRALVYIHNGDYPAALSDLDKVLTIKPDLPQALYKKGVVYLAMGDYNHALASLDAALALKPDYPEALAKRHLILDSLQKGQPAP